jgi:6-pyruvoyltetrahydropterin/6-carboxytetrahydropterin synthase
MSYSIKVSAGFSSAHHLRGYRGKCEALHGHNWIVEAVVVKQDLDKTGMVLDFKLVKSCLCKILEKLDHKYLNELAYFKKNNPTSECIAEYIYKNLKPKIKPLKSVTVWENSSSSATYEE